MKENLKPCAYDRREHDTRACDRVLFVERSGELRVPARGRAIRLEPEGKLSLKRAEVGARKARNRVTYPCPG